MKKSTEFHIVLPSESSPLMLNEFVIENNILSASAPNTGWQRTQLSQENLDKVEKWVKELNGVDLKRKLSSFFD